MSRRRKENKGPTQKKGTVQVPHRAISLPALIGLLLGTGVGIGGALYAGLSSPPQDIRTTQRITYRQARENHSLRDGYIRSFGLEAQYPFLQSVAYAPNLDHPMVTTSLDHPIGPNEREPVVRIGQQSSVYVGPLAFIDQAITSEDDFLSGLVDHEIEGHARYMAKGFPGFAIETGLTPEGLLTVFKSPEGNEVTSLNPVYELFAYEHQLRNPHNRLLSRGLQEHNALKFSWEYVSLIRLITIRAYRDPDQIEDLASRFALPGLINMRSTFSDYTGPTYCDRGHVHITEGALTLPAKAQQRFMELGARPCAARQ